MLLEHLRMKVDDISRLRVKTYDVDSSCKGLQVRIGTGNLAEFVHHGEGIFVCIEIE